MIDYVYRAQNQDTGEVVTANVKAESVEAAAKLLTRQKMFPLEISPVQEKDLLHDLGLKRGVSMKERVLFTRQLSTLITAGLPLARALRTTAEQIKDQQFRKIIDEVVASVEGGSSLADAFAAHPRVFNQIYVAMVAAGETSGKLDETLQRLANQQEKDAAILSKIRSALIYPAIVLILIIGVLILMLATVVPQVAQLYHDLKKTLPIMTQGLLLLSNFVTHFWWLAILIIIAGVWGFRSLWAAERTKYQWDKFKLRVPVFGVIFEKVYMARYARTMNTLLASGVPMLEAMETTKNAVGNRLVADDIGVAIGQVRGGRSLSESLEGSKNFLSLVPQMTKIGEESGQIDEMLGRTANYYEEEVDTAVRNLSTTIEPVMMVVLGTLIALVLGAVLYPIYSLVGSGAITGGH